MPRGTLRRSIWRLVAVFVVLALSGIVAPSRHTLSRAGATSRGLTASPDVVLIITDDQRAAMLSRMPKLRRQLVHRGVRFRRAFVPNPVCCPSRASFYTGTYSHTNGVWQNEGPFGGFDAFDDSSTLSTWLSAAGYRTGLFGKYLNGYHDATVVPPGWDRWFGFISDDGLNYYGFDASEDGVLTSLPDDVYSTVETYERVTDFIVTTPPTQPLFAVWTPLAPHRPFVPEDRYADADLGIDPWRPPDYNERDVSDKPRWLRRTERLTFPERRTLDEERLDQYRTMLSVDDGIAAITSALRRSGRLSNTLLIFSSDNGLMWGEHRLIHKAVAYDGASNVPMLIRYDPLTAGRGSSAVASLTMNIDVAPTIMDIAGIPPGSPVDGESLRPLLDGTAARVRTRFVIEHAEGGNAPAYCGARSRRELFVRYTSGEEEYYRLDRDPWNLVNGVEDRRWRDEVRSLRRYARHRCRPKPPGFSW